MRRLVLLLYAALLALAVAGCGAHSSQTVETGGSGSLRGVQIIPRDGDYNVHVDDWIRVYWPEDYEPPSEFTFTLRSEGGGKVLTYKRSGRYENEWFFEPYTNLDYVSRYVIELTTDTERVVSYFWTEDEEDVYARASKAPPDAGPRSSEALPEHVIHTGMK